MPRGRMGVTRARLKQPSAAEKIICTRLSRARRICISCGSTCVADDTSRANELLAFCAFGSKRRLFNEGVYRVFHLKWDLFFAPLSSRFLCIFALAACGMVYYFYLALQGRLIVFRFELHFSYGVLVVSLYTNCKCSIVNGIFEILTELDYLSSSGLSYLFDSRVLSLLRNNEYCLRKMKLVKPLACMTHKYFNF